MTSLQPYPHGAAEHTNKVIRVEEIIVPDLHGEDWREVTLCLGQAVEVLLLSDDHHVLSREVLHWKHKPPVEITLSVH